MSIEKGEIYDGSGEAQKMASELCDSTCNNSVKFKACNSWAKPFLKVLSILKVAEYITRECVSKGAAGARTRRSLEHHLLHPLILRLLVICAPADFEAQSSLL